MKFNYLSTLIACLLCSLIANADIPAGYYSSINGKSGAELKTALFKVIRPHTQLSYSSMWTYYRKADARPEDPKKVWDMYSNKTYYFGSGNSSSTSGMNREHCVPKSWWGSGSTTTEIMQYEAGSDLMHLYPSDGPANTAKLNYPLGEVSQAKFENGSCKVGYAVSGQGGSASQVFEPADEYKGDFARTYLYMATCYQDYTWKYTYMFNSTLPLTLNGWSKDLLLKWSKDDPVSDKERNRNDVVYSLQGNRNPFIDDPNLIDYIWGDKQGMVYNGGGTAVTGDPELTAPLKNSNIDFGEIGLGKSVSLDVYVKGKNITGNITVTIYRDNAAMFKASVSSVQASQANSEDGYKLTITYTPTEVGSHKARLLFSDGGLSGTGQACDITGTCLAAPTLSVPQALQASDIVNNSYTANWTYPNEDVDYFIVTRTIYRDGEIVSSENFETEETSMVFDIEDGTTHTYYVKASRLGYESNPSNVITVSNKSGIENIDTDRALAVAYVPGGVRFICNETIYNAYIYDMQGRLVDTIDEISNNTVVELPNGAYLIKADGLKQPVKILVR